LTVGAYLRETLEAIAKDEPRIAAVRACGLYAAADFVREDGTPDGDTALRVVNGLRDRRVLISATGPDGNILKIRPPLPFARPHVDRLAEALTDTLRTLLPPPIPPIPIPPTPRPLTPVCRPRPDSPVLRG